MSYALAIGATSVVIPAARTEWPAATDLRAQAASGTGAQGSIPPLGVAAAIYQAASVKGFWPLQSRNGYICAKGRNNYSTN